MNTLMFLKIFLDALPLCCLLFFLLMNKTVDISSLILMKLLRFQQVFYFPCSSKENILSVVWTVSGRTFRPFTHRSAPSNQKCYRSHCARIHSPCPSPASRLLWFWFASVPFPYPSRPLSSYPAHTPVGPVDCMWDVGEGGGRRGRRASLVVPSLTPIVDWKGIWSTIIN